MAVRWLKAWTDNEDSLVPHGMSVWGALKSQVLENASMENVSTKRDIMQGWKMQVLRMHVRVFRDGKRKYENASTEVHGWNTQVQKT